MGPTRDSGQRAFWPVAFAALTIVFISALPVAAADDMSPCGLAMSSDGGRLYVSCHTADAVAVIDTAGPKKIGEIRVGKAPYGVALSPDDQLLYVANSRDGTVSVIAVGQKTRPVVKSFKAGAGPHGLALDKRGRLFVCNRWIPSLSVLDVRTRKEIKRIPMVREPMYVAITPDDSLALVANSLPVGEGNSAKLAADVTLVDTKSLRRIASLRLPTGSIDMRQIVCSPDGKWAYVVHLLSRFLVPTTQLDRGWMNTNALTIIDVAKKQIHATLLLDTVMQGAANPYGIVCSPDGKRIYITHAGTHEVTDIDAAKMHAYVAKVPAEKRPDLANDLSIMFGKDLARRKPTGGRGPHGVAVGPKTGMLYVANYYSGTVTVIDPKRLRVQATVDLGGSKQTDIVRRGEDLFNDATVCFQHWQSCASCHPDGRADGLNWDLMNDGIGNPKNAKSLVLSAQTPPSMATGVRTDADVASRAGFLYILFRQPSDEELKAVQAYVRSLKPAPSPYLRPNGSPTPAAERGKKIFHDTKTGCSKCHPSPLFTDMRTYDVGTRGEFDRRSEFDTPTLAELWRTAPYLHDGSAVTLRDVLTKSNRKDLHGKTSHLKKKQFDDLVAYLLSL